MTDPHHEQNPEQHRDTGDECARPATGQGRRRVRGAAGSGSSGDRGASRAATAGGGRPIRPGAAAGSAPPVGVRRGGTGLSDLERAQIVAAVYALAPMTEEQVDRVCEVIVSTRARWRREDAGRTETGGRRRIPRRAVGSIPARRAVRAARCGRRRR